MAESGVPVVENIGTPRPPRPKVEAQAAAPGPHEREIIGLLEHRSRANPEDTFHRLVKDTSAQVELKGAGHGWKDKKGDSYEQFNATDGTYYRNRRSGGLVDREGNPASLGAVVQKDSQWITGNGQRVTPVEGADDLFQTDKGNYLDKNGTRLALNRPKQDKSGYTIDVGAGESVVVKPVVFRAPDGHMLNERGKRLDLPADETAQSADLPGGAATDRPTQQLDGTFRNTDGEILTPVAYLSKANVAYDDFGRTAGTYKKNEGEIVADAPANASDVYTAREVPDTVVQGKIIGKGGNSIAREVEGHDDLIVLEIGGNFGGASDTEFAKKQKIIEKQTDIPPEVAAPRVLKVWKENGKIYQLTERAKGVPLHDRQATFETWSTELKILAEAHPDQYRKFVVDAAKLQAAGFTIDPSKPDNFFYDKEAGFQFIDLDLAKSDNLHDPEVLEVPLINTYNLFSKYKTQLDPNTRASLSRILEKMKGARDVPLTYDLSSIESAIKGDV